MKRIGILILGLGLIFLIIKGWWDAKLSPISADKTKVSFIVTKGESVDEIANSLRSKNLIKSPFFFKLFLKQHELDAKLQNGTFKLSPSMSVAEIADNLTKSPQDSWVTLLEGWRKEEMGEKLKSELGVKSEEFIKKAKEGYMFPDTYLFPKEITVDGIIKTLRNNFEEKYSDEIRSKIKKLGLDDEEGVILASIVEREARSDGARTMVASILLKRLKIGMGLNADATIQYALGYQPNEKSWWKKSLTKDDLKIDSPYNTYLHRGLPTAPICNPSLASLTAVANADPSTPYLYYYHDSKGVSHYAKTLEEHNENVAKYL